MTLVQARQEAPKRDVSQATQLNGILLHFEIEMFNARYAAALDQERLSDWVEMFTDEALYEVISRENFDRQLRAGLIYCENKRMIKDRALALKETEMFAPRYLRHFITNLAVLGQDDNEDIRATANYVLMQVLFDCPNATLHQVGVYHDVFRRENGQLKLAKRSCVYDSLLIDNALCFPV